MRKTFARKVYQNSGHDILVVKAALHHTDVCTTQKYLEAEGAAVLAAISAGDFTRGSHDSRKRHSPAPALVA